MLAPTKTAKSKQTKALKSGMTTKKKGKKESRATIQLLVDENQLQVDQTSSRRDSVKSTPRQPKKRDMLEGSRPHRHKRSESRLIHMRSTPVSPKGALQFKNFDRTQKVKRRKDDEPLVNAEDMSNLGASTPMMTPGSRKLNQT